MAEIPGPEGSIQTLDRELGTADFAINGWGRLVGLADYLAFLVDGRTTGVYAIGDPLVFERVVGLASVVKAAAQWFASDDGPRPPFVAGAERYLAESAHGTPIVAPLVVPELPQWNLRTGPVVQRKGAQGQRGRLLSLDALKRRVVALVEPLTEDDIRIHLRAYQERKDPTKQGKLHPFPLSLAGQIVVALMGGTLNDLLRAQALRWDPDRQGEAMQDAIADYFESEALLERHLGTARGPHLAKLAERVIVVALESLGITLPKDLFRDRRGSLP